MGDFNEEDHPRDGGKFTAKGGGTHVANTEKAATAEPRAGEAEKHWDAAAKRRGAAKARRAAAEKTKDPAERSEHLARANHHDEKAQAHEEHAMRAEGGKKGREEHPLAEWVAKRLEGAKEGVRQAGEQATEAQEKVEELKAPPGGRGGGGGMRG